MITYECSGYTFKTNESGNYYEIRCPKNRVIRNGFLEASADDVAAAELLRPYVRDLDGLKEVIQ